MKSIDRSGIVLLLVMIIWPAFSFAQDECRVMNAFEDGSFLVQIGDTNYRAISEDQMKKILKMNADLKTALLQYEMADSLLKKYDHTIQLYDTTFSKQKKYIIELEDIFAGYKQLVNDYKKLTIPTLSIEGGVGVTGKDFDPAVLAGLRYSKIHFWGFLQQKNSGILIGTNFVLF